VDLRVIYEPYNIQRHGRYSDLWMPLPQPDTTSSWRASVQEDLVPTLHTQAVAAEKLPKQCES
jgi:hypothetical protein